MIPKSPVCLYNSFC